MRVNFGSLIQDARRKSENLKPAQLSKISYVAGQTDRNGITQVATERRRAKADTPAEKFGRALAKKLFISPAESLRQTKKTEFAAAVKESLITYYGNGFGETLGDQFIKEGKSVTPDMVLAIVAAVTATATTTATVATVATKAETEAAKKEMKKESLELLQRISNTTPTHPKYLEYDENQRVAFNRVLVDRIRARADFQAGTMTHEQLNAAYLDLLLGSASDPAERSPNAAAYFVEDQPMEPADATVEARTTVGNSLTDIPTNRGSWDGTTEALEIQRENDLRKRLAKG